MDGYALKHSDLSPSDNPFKVVGTSLAGNPYHGEVSRQECVRIFTGAMVPDTCDTVVLQEDTVVQEDEFVQFTEQPDQGANIRKIGHDIMEGTTLLQAGTEVTPFETAWLAACGVNTLQVNAPIKVAVFSTGDELQSPGSELGPGQIYDSNRTALLHLLRNKHAQVQDLGCMPDQPVYIRHELQQASHDCDVIVTSGGVSVGDADFVKPIVEELGELTFWNVALKPGKPIAIGKVGEAWFFGLPGNPVSTIVTYLLFVSTALDRLSGRNASQPLTFKARLATPVEHKPGRREFQRGILRGKDGELTVSVANDQSSNRLSTFSNTNALIVVHESLGDLQVGDDVEVLLLPREASHILYEPA